jgi:DnaJ-class molecular chaperone
MGEAQLKTEECGYCGGKSEGQCPICKGSGYVLVAQPAQKCLNCKGKGRIKRYALSLKQWVWHEDCDSCNATGWALGISQAE